MFKRIIAMILSFMMTFCVGVNPDVEKQFNPNTQQEIVSTDKVVEPEIVPNDEDNIHCETENKVEQTIPVETKPVENKTEEKKENVKVETNKTEEKPAVDNREKITMIDLNVVFVSADTVSKKDSMIRIVKGNVSKQEVPSEYKGFETELLNVLNGEGNTFEYMFPSYPETVKEVFTNNHMIFGCYQAILFSSCSRQSNGSYKFTVNIESTRESISKAKYYNSEYERLNRLYKQKITDAVISAGITNGMAKEDAIKKIDAYIRKINTYDYSRTYYYYTDIFEHGTSVCNGYAHLFYLMAQKCGIDCKMVSSAKMNHIWNVVQFDGKSLYVDSTWNDTTNSNAYLLLTKEQMAKSHNFSDAVIKTY